MLKAGTAEAKGHAAVTLAQLARRAGCASQIAEAGAVSAFVQWLADPLLGPPEVACTALSEIAIDNTDTQTQIAEEAAISHLVAMVGAWSLRPAGPSAEPVDARAAKAATAAALKVANLAAGTLATLAKGNLIVQAMVTEEQGILPLVDLLRVQGGQYENAIRALWHLAATEESQTAVAHAGGITPLVGLLASESELDAMCAAGALRALAREHVENQILISHCHAIPALIELLGSSSSETQQHSVGALLHLASHDVSSRNAVVQRLVQLLSVRNAAAVTQATEALTVLAGRSEDNRKAITAANAIEPLVQLLGDGRRVRAGTPQERAAAVLADLARSGDNKQAIVKAGAVGPLVAMLSSDSVDAQTRAAAGLWQLAALGSNRQAVTDNGAIPPLVALLESESTDAHKYASGALWHLASSADNKLAMVAAGAIPLLVAILSSRSSEAREHAAAVTSSLARTQGGNKRAVFLAGGVDPLVALLSDPRAATQKHAACALWGLSDGKDGVYDRQIAEAGAILPLISMLKNDDSETRGFAVACLLCLCKDPAAHGAILEAGGGAFLQDLARGPATWLRGQVVEMLTLLGMPIPQPSAHSLHLPAAAQERPATGSQPSGRAATRRAGS